MNRLTIKHRLVSAPSNGWRAGYQRALARIAFLGTRTTPRRFAQAKRRRSFAGAWIETGRPKSSGRGRSFAGAWIETVDSHSHAASRFTSQLIVSRLSISGAPWSESREPHRSRGQQWRRSPRLTTAAVPPERVDRDQASAAGQGAPHVVVPHPFPTASAG